MSSMLVVTAVGLLATATATTDRRVVIRAEAVARAEASPEAAEVARLPLGSSVDIAGRRGRWTQIRLPEGKQGWVLRASLGRKLPSNPSLCARGRSLYSAGHIASAVAYLKV